MRLFGVLVAAVLFAGVCAPAANGAWTRPAVLVRGDDAGLFDTVVGPGGSVRAAILDSKRGIALGLVDGDGAFGDPLVALRSPAQVAQVALAADGSGVALDVQGDGRSRVVAFDAGGAPRPLVALDEVGDGPDVAVSPAGAALAAWVAKSAQGFEVRAAFRDPGSATFGAPVRAGFAASAHTLVYAGIADSGEAVVAWQTNGFPSDVAAAVRLPGGGFSAARFVARSADDARLAVGPGGQAILAAGRGAGLVVSVKPPGADAMPAATRVDHGRGFALDVAAAGPRGVAAAWVAGARVANHARVRVFAGDARLRRIGTVGHEATGDRVRVAVDGAGATVVAWEEALKVKRGEPTARSHLGIAYRPAGARRLRAPVYAGPVSLAATPESVQVGSGGRAWVFYEAFQSGDVRDRPGYRRVYVTQRRP